MSSSGDEPVPEMVHGAAGEERGAADPLGPDGLEHFAWVAVQQPRKFQKRQSSQFHGRENHVETQFHRFGCGFLQLR